MLRNMADVKSSTGEGYIHNGLVESDSPLMNLLRPYGAKGQPCPGGELISQKQLCLCLREYIKDKKLYDEYDPRIVRCDSDPLGDVFAVERFTLFDVINLLKNHIKQPDTFKKEADRNNTDVLSNNNIISQKRFNTGNVSNFLKSSKRIRLNSSEKLVSGNEDHTRPEEIDEKRNEVNSTDDEDVSPTIIMQRRRKRKQGKNVQSSPPGESPGEGGSRIRQSSLSIVYTDDQDDGCPLFFAFEVESEGDSEVLSVQSKETALVKDSSDDYWFLDSDDEISLQMADGSFSVQFGPDGPELTSFSEEYEVLSQSTSFVDSMAEFEGDSESPIEDIVVVCSSGDTDFWADSESSDTEQDSTDEDLKDDKWSCGECHTMNSPLLRYCARCWKLRQGWLPDLSPRKRPPRRNKLISHVPVCKRTETLQPLAPNYTAIETLLPEREKAMSVTEKVDLLLDRNICVAGISLDKPHKPKVELKRSDTLILPESSASATNTQHLKKSLLKKDDSGFGSFLSIAQDDQHSADNLCAPLESNILNIFPTLPCSPNRDFNKNLKTKGVVSTSVMGILNKSPVKTKLFPADSADMCVVCLSKPKEASIIHGKTGHQVCCYVCAKQLRKRGKPCPVCRRPIQKVIKNFMV